MYGNNNPIIQQMLFKECSSWKENVCLCVCQLSHATLWDRWPIFSIAKIHSKSTHFSPFPLLRPWGKSHHHLLPTTLHEPSPGLPLVPRLWSILHGSQSNLSKISYHIRSFPCLKSSTFFMGSQYTQKKSKPLIAIQPLPMFPRHRKPPLIHYSPVIRSSFCSLNTFPPRLCETVSLSSVSS